jgi:quercetin dioxygenase-like cupin family protein
MIKKNYLDIGEEEVTTYGSSGVTVRWLITKKDGASRYAMRRFEIEPDGQINLHSHAEEHEIYVLSGKARVFNDEGFETIAIPGDVLFVPPYETHGYETVSEDPFSFLCIIPLLKS